MRRAGIGAIRNKSLAQSRFKDKGEALAESHLADLTRQLDALKLSLEEFAEKHQAKIRQNSEFRTQFQAMCANIGVDPLASSHGYWSKMLGLGDFYYHMAVRIVEVCMANQRHSGGLMPLKDLVIELNRTKSSRESDIGTDDVVRAIKKLNCLGNGFSIISLSDGRQLVQSVPGDLNVDQTNVLSLAESHSGGISVRDCCKKLSWNTERCLASLEYLQKEGMAWVDNQDPSGECTFWFPSLFATKDT